VNLLDKKIIFVVDDDHHICNLLKSQLINDGYEVEVFYEAIDALDRISKKIPDLLITDIMMPVISGYDLCKEVRKISDIPIIMISAKSEEIDRVVGLELGSDDYIVKPFSLREISVKVKHMLRRASTVPTLPEDVILCKDVEIKIQNREVFINKRFFETTAKEYDLLFFLIKNCNKAFTREQIIQAVWGYDFCGDSRQVDHLVKRLRKKMLLENSECKIETLWGYGYKVSD